LTGIVGEEAENSVRLLVRRVNGIAKSADDRGTSDADSE
jgi:hypothetical protein